MKNLRFLFLAILFLNVCSMQFISAQSSRTQLIKEKITPAERTKRIIEAISWSTLGAISIALLVSNGYFCFERYSEYSKQIEGGNITKAKEALPGALLFTGNEIGFTSLLTICAYKAIHNSIKAHKLRKECK